ncbi:MAG: COX15/CtaA family protein [Planctomycetota bacterium]
MWPGVVIGFGTAVTMWILWYVMHLPSIRVSAPISATVLLIALIGSVCLGTRGLGAVAPRVGLVSGLTAGLINLMLLGSKITEAGSTPGEATATFLPSAPLIVAGFLTICVSAGLAGGLAGRVLAPRRLRHSGFWLARFACIAIASLIPLIVVGGAVTSAGAGMSVPDWPGTYGSNMFLYPIGLMADPYIFLEHTHRLFGTLVGLTTLTLMVATLVSRTSRFSKILACCVFVGVCIQGILGGIRVTGINEAYGAVHGVLAQLIFASMVILAASMTNAWRSRVSLPTETLKAATAMRRVAVATSACLLLQLTLASLYRHTGSQHALWAHIAFAIVVAVLVGVLGFTLQRAEDFSDAGRGMRRVGRILIVAVIFQFLIGFAAWGVAGEGGPDRVVPTEAIGTVAGPAIDRTIIATIHQANGAFILSMTALGLGWGYRFGRTVTAAKPADAGNVRAAPALG